MGKKSMEITGISIGPENTQALVVVYEEQELEGEIQKVPLGEATISFPSKLADLKVTQQVRATARDIIKKSDEARDKRAALNKLLETEAIE